jgi:inner membrane protein
VSSTEQHRGLLHSFWGLGIAAAIAMPLAFTVGWAPATALVLGYASHLVADSATKSGIRLLYPGSRRFYLLPAKLRITTRSLAEEVLAALLLVPTSLLLLSSLFAFV